MKDYLNIFHSILSDVHFWDDLSISKKKEKLSKYFVNFNKIDHLLDYFDNFKKELLNISSYLRQDQKILSIGSGLGGLEIAIMKKFNRYIYTSYLYFAKKGKTKWCIILCIHL